MRKSAPDQRGSSTPLPQKKQLMKMQSKLTLLGSLMALAASPLAFADKTGPATSEVAPDAVVNEPITATKVDEPVKGTVDDKATDPASEAGVDAEPSVPAKGGETTDEGTIVPIDWVKRGGEYNPEIAQNMAGGEAPVFKAETSSVSKELGQDEKAADIESKENAGAPLIEHAKKGPVALIKKGRVFLR
jgi:hypothetical protein